MLLSRSDPKPLLLLFALLILALPLNGCEDNPVGSGGWDHVPAVGYELEMNGKVLVSYFLREFLFDPTGAHDEYIVHDQDIYAGSFLVGGKVVFQEHHLDPNSRKTPEFTIYFLDENRERLIVPEFYRDGVRSPDGEWNLDFQYFLPRSREQQLDPEERPFEAVYDKTKETWKFHLRGKSHGEGGLRINLFHLDHYDMTSIPLPVKMKLE
ncbi:hypothetical protein QA596_06475 [Balneolales bacterium ANBcel1]|nr:hypothetical protein [Balneolales bacterium ANBcel1]